MKWPLALLCTTLLWTGCSNEESQPTATRWRITLFSGTDPVRYWTSTSEPKEEGKPEGFSFWDEETGHHYRITGSIVVETLQP